MLRSSANGSLWSMHVFYAAGQHSHWQRAHTHTRSLSHTHSRSLTRTRTHTSTHTHTHTHKHARARCRTRSHTVTHHVVHTRHPRTRAQVLPPLCFFEIGAPSVVKLLVVRLHCCWDLRDTSYSTEASRVSVLGHILTLGTACSRHGVGPLKSVLPVRRPTAVARLHWARRTRQALNCEQDE